MKKKLRILSTLAFAAWTLFEPVGGYAQSALHIFEKADKAAYTKTSRSKMTQTVITPGGDKRSFKMLSYSRNGNEKSLTVYVSPNQVRGMKILTLDDGNDIWTYFPRTNRTRKIASSARNRKVQGSDFTYDDMATGKMAKQWQGKVIGEEKVAGKMCFKISATPTSSGPKSYSKATVWIAKSDFTAQKIEYYDLDGDRIKRLDIGNYKKISGVLVPSSYTMTNLTDGGKTIMKAVATEINVPLDANLFREAGLGN